MLIANYDFEIDKKVYAEEAAEDAYAEGKLEGDIKGKLEGKLEGENKRAREVALRMLEDGLPIEKVAEYSGLSVEQIKALQ